MRLATLILALTAAMGITSVAVAATTDARTSPKGAGIALLIGAGIAPAAGTIAAAIAAE